MVYGGSQTALPSAPRSPLRSRKLLPHGYCPKLSR